MAGTKLFDATLGGTPEQAPGLIESILESSTEYSIIGKDLDGNILLWNEGARRIYGYEPEEVVGKASSSILHAPEDVAAGKPREILDAALRDGKWEGTINRRRKNGQQFPARVVVTPRRDTVGRPIGFLLISKDISDEIRLTEQLMAANRDLEAFSYSVSHDLRAPLRAIDGYSRILAEECNDRLDDEGRRLLGIVRSESQRMGQLIDELLAFSRVGRQRMEPREVDMRALAEAAFKEAGALEPDRKVRAQIAALPVARGEAVMLRQVWANLLSNAVKFTRHRDEPRIEAGASRGNGETVYFVRDNGAGFDMAHAGKLFGVFQRLHGEEEFEGTGVGLAFVKRIIQRHGGRVWAEGAIDKGATFYFALPDRTQTETTT
jgi:PAS domain S-box-containing protein